jgi:hypothetical protein
VPEHEVAAEMLAPVELQSVIAWARVRWQERRAPIECVSGTSRADSPRTPRLDHDVLM